MSTQTEQQLRPVVGPVVERLGYDLEGLSVSAAGRRHVLKVVVDRDGGFGLDDVADLSRELSAALDHDDVLPGSFVLEVSSRGVDRPLELARHWRRNVDRLVKVRLADGTELTSRISSADETAAVLTDDDTGGSRTVAYAGVARAVVQVELRPRKGERVEELDEVDDLEGPHDSDGSGDRGDDED